MSMGVYIKGMEMPCCCDECRFLDEYGDYPCCIITDEQRGYNFKTREKRMDNCPLVPAADVRPVVRGKWNNIFGEVPGTTNFTVSLPQCSECGFVFNWNSPYCPSCGADMRAEEGE